MGVLSLLMNKRMRNSSSSKERDRQNIKVHWVNEREMQEKGRKELASDAGRGALGFKIHTTFCSRH
jgi:hypothetical protein